MKKNTDRRTPLEIDPKEFRKLGYGMVDRVSDFLSELHSLPLTRGESPKTIRKLLRSTSLPERGMKPDILLRQTADLLINHSLFNGHRNFFGYITSSAAPIGALGDLLAASINPNVGSFTLAPVATEIEAQTIGWIAEMISYPKNCGGILVSGGNMANFVCFLAARKAKASWDIRSGGIANRKGRPLRVYTSSETHTWINKAADMFGLGTDAIRWIPTDRRLRIDTTALQRKIREDKKKGDFPFIVIGTAGSVSTGAIDPLPELATICREHKLWFHVDGAYGGLAAVLPDAPSDLKGLSLADSVAVDPHKWLYAPLEVGCALVRNRNALRDTFSYHVSYYRFHESEDETPLNYFEYGPQNSRGFRALKVWLALRQVGRVGYRQMISDDIALAKELFTISKTYPELQVFTNDLSITTLRFVPKGLSPGNRRVESYLNDLNEKLLLRMQNEGEAFLSNAVINKTFVLRACIVNFRTSIKDIHSLPGLIIHLGRALDKKMRPSGLAY